MVNGELVRAAIGRVASIGDLYDARSDKFCGISLLKKRPPDSVIRITDNPFTDVQFIHSDTYSDKFEKLDIKAELKVSILAGLFSLEGSGRYLKDEKKSARAVRSSLLYNIQTKVEHINLFSEELMDCFALDALNVKSATHVVVEVSWGANSMITMEYSNSQNRDIKQIEGELQAQLNKLSLSISGKASVDYASGEESKEENYKLHVFGDIMPTDEDLPQTFKEALALMKKLPRLVQSANDGKGKPLRYILVPLSTLEQYLKVSNMADRMIKQIDEQAIIRFVQLFDEISAMKQQLYDLYDSINAHKYCVPNERIQKVGSIKNKLDSDEASLRSKLAKLLIEVRSGRSGADKLEALIEESITGDLSINKIQDFIISNSDVVEKINFADILEKERVTYIGAGYGTSLEGAKLNNFSGDIYVLFFENLKNKSEHQHWSDNKHHFLRLVKLENDENESSYLGINNTSRNEKIIKTFIAVDLEMRPELAEIEGVKSGTRICHFKNGKYINYDVLLEYMTRNDRCLVKCSQLIQLVMTKPNKRVILELRCPGSLSGYCDNTEHTWFCYKCEEMIDHGFDGYFYCNCGKAPNDRYQFKCNSDKHGLDFMGFTSDQLAQLLSKIRPMKEMNILILGETGVGKSTWINGLVNYMTFKSLGDAEHNKPLSLIAASFTMTDENYTRREIKIGSDKNEVQAAGQSATQGPKAYVLDWGKTLVRLVDTPGIGDTRGIEKDKENFDAILRYIANLKELHGICILLKPNNARLTVMFQFCIKELLTHLHRSASDNIVFCFTNARGTFYRPGDTLPALQSLLEENKDVRIELSKHTIYCMDNESFRFLCAVHNGIQFDEDERRNYAASWDKSVAETNRLFEHIAGLKPHTTKDTISLNDARKVILNLTKPMADISKNIQTNIAIIEDKKNEIMSSEKSQKELLNKLYVPQVVLVAEALQDPRTVCAASKCVEYHTIPGTNETIRNFVKHCHKQCGLSGVEKETYPNPELKNCAAMNSNYNCNNCGCSWDKHMHIYYEYRQETQNVINESVQNMINSKRSDVEKVNIYIDNMESKIKQLKGEQEQITSVSVKFGCFLKTNAISPYNDALKEYLQVLIRLEKDKVNAGGDQKSLDGLETMLNNYLEEARVLEKSMASGQNIELLGPNEVNELVKSLYSLPINGEQLRNIMEVGLASKARMQTTYSETHYSARKYSHNIKGKRSTGNTNTNTELSLQYNTKHKNNVDNESKGSKSNGKGFKFWGYKIW